uniref:Uncharacterized protein n=1 Tax=Bursaphelenchus xylophilus TaxID=6326 RepID=A0A1I7SRV5_BURXY
MSANFQHIIEFFHVHPVTLTIRCRLPANVGCPQIFQAARNCRPCPQMSQAARKCRCWPQMSAARKVAARKKFARKLVARKVVARKCAPANLLPPYGTK